MRQRRRLSPLANKVCRLQVVLAWQGGLEHPQEGPRSRERAGPPVAFGAGGDGSRPQEDPPGVDQGVELDVAALALPWAFAPHVPIARRLEILPPGPHPSGAKPTGGTLETSGTGETPSPTS